MTTESRQHAIPPLMTEPLFTYILSVIRQPDAPSTMNFRLTNADMAYSVEHEGGIALEWRMYSPATPELVRKIEMATGQPVIQLTGEYDHQH